MIERLSRYYLENLVNITMEWVGMLLDFRALKSVNNKDKIQQRIICTIFNGSTGTMMVTFHSPTSAIAESSIIGLMSWVFTTGPRNRGSIQGRVILKSQKWYLMPPCLAQHYKVSSKGKVEQSRECSSTLSYTSV